MHFEILIGISGLYPQEVVAMRRQTGGNSHVPPVGMKKIHNSYQGEMGRWEVGEVKWGERGRG